MSNPKWDERVIVISREDLFENEDRVFQGVMPIEQYGMHQKGEELLFNISENWNVLRRGNEKDPTPAENNAEINYDYKQLIPYCVIRRGNEIFVYKRLSAGGEERLFDKYSIGVGGHMNDFTEEEKDLLNIGIFPDFALLLTDNIERELAEELFISDNEKEAEIVGLINDDSDSVGKVHLGILIVIDVNEDAVVEVQEKDQLQGEWMTLEDLLKVDNYSMLENWSKLTVDVLK